MKVAELVRKYSMLVGQQVDHLGPGPEVDS